MRYTKQMIYDSLVDIMAEKPVSDITTTELCRRADINRNTFYTHYHNPEDVLKQVEKNFTEEILKIAIAKHRAPVIELLTDVCQFIESNRRFCRAVFGLHGDPTFLRSITWLAYDHAIHEWQKLAVGHDKRDLTLLYTFLANGAYGLVQDWVLNDFQEKPEKVAAFLEKGIVGTIHSLQNPSENIAQ